MSAPMRTILVAVVFACGAPAKQERTPTPTLTPPPPAVETQPPPPPRNELVAMTDDVCRCKDKACLDQVTKKYTKKDRSNDEIKPPTDEEMQALRRMAKCMQDLQQQQHGVVLRPNAPAPWAGTGVAECDELVTTYERLFDCDVYKQMPPEAQEAQRSGLQSMKDSWRFDDAAAKEAAKPGCLAALDGLRQSAKAMGCSL
jgi:hypothetical protein